jgi:predicted transcriptional regulator
MARIRKELPQVWERIALLMLENSQAKVMVKEIHDKLDIHMYRLSNYIWNIKKNGGYVRSLKIGRDVVGYQLANPDTIKDHLTKRKFISQIETLEDLNATPIEQHEHILS